MVADLACFEIKWKASVKPKNVINFTYCYQLHINGSAPLCNSYGFARAHDGKAATLIVTKYTSSVSGSLHHNICRNGILFPKLFWPTVRKNCSSDWEKLLKFKSEGWEFATFLRTLEHFIRTVKGKYSFWNRIFNLSLKVFLLRSRI